MLNLDVETALPLDTLRRQMPSTVAMIYSMDVGSRLIWLASIRYLYYIIQKLSKTLIPEAKLTCVCVMY